MVVVYYSKTYAIQIFFYYLMKEKGVSKNAILDYYVEERNKSPQEYWCKLFGKENFENWFADWTVHNAADMDYLTREEFNESAYDSYPSIARDKECSTGLCDPHPYVWEGTDEGTSGWERPPANLTTRGWSYNVWRLKVTKAASYK